MANHYFSVCDDIKKQIEDCCDDIEKVYTLFTVNNPSELRSKKVTAHLMMLPSTFRESEGNGKIVSEAQKIQVSICFAAPSNEKDELEFSEKSGQICDKIRIALQGFKCNGSLRGLRLIGNQFNVTSDCRFRIISFIFENVKIF